MHDRAASGKKHKAGEKEREKMLKGKIFACKQHQCICTDEVFPRFLFFREVSVLLYLRVSVLSWAEATWPQLGRKISGLQLSHSVLCARYCLLLLDVPVGVVKVIAFSYQLCLTLVF